MKNLISHLKSGRTVVSASLTSPTARSGTLTPQCLDETWMSQYTKHLYQKDFKASWRDFKMETPTLLRKLSLWFCYLSSTNRHPIAIWNEAACSSHGLDVITLMFALLSCNPQLSGVPVPAESTRSSHGFQNPPKLGK